MVACARLGCRTRYIGAIGNDVPGARATFTLGASLKVPVFAGGRVSAKVHEAEAHLAQERARLEDLKARIYYEVRNVFLDLKAASDRVQVAESKLRQARDRFEAGVADNLEVVQAQQTLADAEESRIASLYAYNAAKFSLAHALGGAEASYAEILKGR